MTTDKLHPVRSCGELQELIKNFLRLRPGLFVNGSLRARARARAFKFITRISRVY